jgi:stress response protein SCP2
MNLQSGQNIPLQQSAIRLNLQYPAKFGFKGEPDTCLFLLNAQGKVSGDSDFIFYNNLSSPEGAVKLVTGSQQSSIDIALDRVPANVSKIAITVVIDGEDTISGLSLLSIQAPGIADFQAETQGRSEKAIILGEVYRHNGARSFVRSGRVSTVDLSLWPLAMALCLHSQLRSQQSQLVSVWKRNWKPDLRAL